MSEENKFIKTLITITDYNNNIDIAVTDKYENNENISSHLGFFKYRNEEELDAIIKKLSEMRKK